MMIGLEYLPAPIVQYLRNSVRDRPKVPHLYHVTDLLYCLRKAYFRRKHPNGAKGVKSLWNIVRGQTFDHLWSPLFEVNQRTYTVHRGGITITGTLDFIFSDQGERVLCDLKMPASTYYRKQYGASDFYQRQVQCYLAMAHANGDLLDIQKARILMLAEDLVVEDVQENPEILDYLWTRAFRLDHALTRSKPDALEGPEEAWECNPEYCEHYARCKGGDSS